jgi:hypothetical protein
MKALANFFGDLTLTKKALLWFSSITTFFIDLDSGIVGLLLIILLDLLTAIRANLHKRNIKFKPFNPEFFLDLKNYKFKIFNHGFWKNIKSNGFRQTWKKSYEYLIGIITIHIVQNTVLMIPAISIFDREMTLTDIAINIAILIEVYSIFENMEKVSGRNLLKILIEFLKSSVSSISGKLKWLPQKLTDKVEEDKEK